MNKEYENNYYDENNNNSNITIDSQILSEEEVNTGKSPKNGKGIPPFMKVASTALVFGLVAGMAFQGFNYVSGHLQAETQITESDNSSPSGTESNEVAAITTSTDSAVSENDVSTVAENVMPSIVSISCKVTENVQDVFGRVYSNEATGSGSGIIIGQNSSAVLIATNNHVIDGANEVTISFVDGTTAPATIKGTDSSNDLAVVAVKLSDLSSDTKTAIKVAALGNSDSLKVGQMAIAIGNALGYGQSVTVGYISALDRQVSVEDNTMTLIQTDAAINPGNSGGALLNAKGEVIGINSVKYASSDVEGMGYAIPISEAVPIITELMNAETIEESEQAYLGIKGIDVTETYAANFNMPEGVYIGEVTANSPADQAGLYAGSIITEFNGKDASTMEKLQRILSNTRAGDTAALTVEILQNGKYVKKTVNVSLGSKADIQTNDSSASGNNSREETPQITIPFMN